MRPPPYIVLAALAEDLVEVGDDLLEFVAEFVLLLQDQLLLGEAYELLLALIEGLEDIAPRPALEVLAERVADVEQPSVDDDVLLGELLAGDLQG